jgi:hypothetical protein
VRAERAQATRPTGSEALEQENKQLQTQLARAEMERGILSFRIRRADETLRFHCLACCLLAHAVAVPAAGCQPERLLRLA